MAATHVTIRVADGPQVRAVVEAFRDLLAEQSCPSTSGGTDGKWCLNHDDQRMVDDERCHLIVWCHGVLSALDSVVAA